MSATHKGGNAQPTIDVEEHRSVNGVDAKATMPYGQTAGITKTLPLKVSDNGDGTGTLVVDAEVTLEASDIQIGSVEIKDGDSDARLDVESSGTKNAAYVQSETLATAAHQATANASLSILDDWDESDRAKVNPVAGQAGVQGGAGAATANTQRVALATDANTINLPVGVVLYETEAELGSNANVASSFIDVTDYDFIDIIVNTDQSSASNGAKLLLSADEGANYKTIQNTIAVPSPGTILSLAYSIPVTAYNAIKLDYTNGTTAQGIFHLRIVGNRGANPLPLAPLGAGIDPTLTGVLTRSILAAQNTSGSMTNITLTASNNVPVSIAEATAEVPIKALTALNVGQQTITTTASQVTSAATGRNTIALKSLTANTAAIYIGTSSGVTSSNGFPLDAGESIEFDLTEGQALYAIAGSGSQVLGKAEVS